MADGAAFTLAALWENGKDPESGEWVRTFTIITTEANALVAELHDRMDDGREPARLFDELLNAGDHAEARGGPIY